MERRLLLVFALTFLVILLSQPLIKKYLPQPPTPPAQTQTKTETPAQPAQTGAVPTAVAKPEVPVAAVSGIKQTSTESETVIENDLYRITFTNRGALVKSWILKKFDDDRGNSLELVNSV